MLKNGLALQSRLNYGAVRLASDTRVYVVENLTMSKHKNQHFVPKFILRNFSNNLNQKTIGVWVISSNSFVSDAPIEGQASGNYFYGKDGNIENAFQTIEDKAAPIINLIIVKHKLPVPLSEEHVSLVAFIVSLSLRTQYAAQSITELANSFFKLAMEDNPRFKDILDKLELRSSNPPAEALRSLETCIIISLDLGYKILINMSNHPFIISDNPVIKYNHLSRSPYQGGLGFGSTGLELLLPLNPGTYLLLYDKSSYKVGARKQFVVEINDSLVDELNICQYLNAGETIFFNNQMSEAHLKDLSIKERRHRLNTAIEVEEFEAVDNPNHSLITGHQNPIKHNLCLPFIRTLKKAKTDTNPDHRWRNLDLINRLTEEKKTIQPASLADYPQYFKSKRHPLNS